MFACSKARIYPTRDGGYFSTTPDEQADDKPEERRQHRLRDGQSGVLDRRLHALERFLYSGVRKPQDGHPRQTLPGIDLDLHDHPLQSDHGTGCNAGEHEHSLPLSRTGWGAKRSQFCMLCPIESLSSRVRMSCNDHPPPASSNRSFQIGVSPKRSTHFAIYSRSSWLFCA